MAMSQTFRSISMPIGMVVGALFCRKIVWIDTALNGVLTPIFIFSMLFITFCCVDARKIRFSWMYVWMLLFQVVASFALYYLFAMIDVVVAQGAMICALAPVAMAAVVIGGMLGAKLENMVAYSLLCNVVIALYAPLLLHSFGNGECTMMQILQRVAPLLIAPFVAGQFCRFALPKAGAWISNHRQLSFYIWLVSLVVIVGRTTCFIIDHKEANRQVEIMLAIVAFVICLLQFGVGRWIGRRYGDTVAGGQSLGQKNTVLAVWLSQAFLDPVSSVAPTAYIVWQNIVNSYQLWRRSSRA